MVDRSGIQPRSQLRGAGAGKLLGVEAQAEARGDGRPADSLGGGKVEEAGVGEHVDELGEAFRGHRGDHLVRHLRGMVRGADARRGRRGRRGTSKPRGPAVARRRAG